MIKIEDMMDKINNFKKLKYDDEFFYVKNEEIIKYCFICVDENINTVAYFKKIEKDGVIRIVPVSIYKFKKFYVNEIDAKNELKNKIFEKLYACRIYKKDIIREYEMTDFNIKDYIFIIFTENLDFDIGVVFYVGNKRFDLNYDENRIVYDSYRKGFFSCVRPQYGPGYGYDSCNNKLFFKNQDEARAKLYELLCEKLTNRYDMNLNGYEFKEGEIIWMVVDNVIMRKVMKEGEIFNDKGFFFEKHAKEFLIVENINKLKENINKLKGHKNEG